MKSTEFTTMMLLIGCTYARHHHAGVRFVEDLQYEATDGVEQAYESLTQAEVKASA